MHLSPFHSPKNYFDPLLVLLYPPLTTFLSSSLSTSLSLQISFSSRSLSVKISFCPTLFLSSACRSVCGQSLFGQSDATFRGGAIALCRNPMSGRAAPRRAAPGASGPRLKSEHVSRDSAPFTFRHFFLLSLEITRNMSKATKAVQIAYILLLVERCRRTT